MTRLLLLCLLSIFTFSCQEDEKPYNEYPQTWKIAGWRVFGFGGDSGFQTISDSSYTYLFKKDGTYVKTVGEESTSGTYKQEFKIYEVGGERKEYILNFEEDILRHSCFANREYLFIDENGMLVGGSAPCDGASLYFTLVE
ncbi:hypothetical protein PBT90_19235 [Algoriphagus halophytocola]|uniref:Lipocalin-like domain-containing protein n=1 Tax=Algoriphagus halophytocola TaxID=2991499 RepID=A0ABY6MD50_9BACT|nr:MULTISPECIES: hypothetical protein [unclassified Algoriphagus]UZD21650.1 hypothetical protein OM944_13370 [Algoriphagus sp. TR-M5]WBL42862.1 hypothetical protein PBT90_19235 [Algoriphagus sp. TR-M9]